MSHPGASTAIAAELPNAPVVASAEPKPKTAEAIVESRLASSKLLAKEFNDIVVGLRTLVLGPKEDAENEEGLEVTGSDNEPTVGQPEDEENEDGSGASDDSAAKADDAGWESGSISQDDVGDPDDSTDLSSEVEQPPTKRQKKSMPPKVHTNATDLSAKKKPHPRPSHPSLKDDFVFLPSLSVGFIKGDSDISGDEIDSDAGSVEPVRKNRRGQRARQQ
jgi:BUD22